MGNNFVLHFTYGNNSNSWHLFFFVVIFGSVQQSKQAIESSTGLAMEQLNCFAQSQEDAWQWLFVFLITHVIPEISDYALEKLEQMQICLQNRFVYSSRREECITVCM